MPEEEPGIPPPIPLFIPPAPPMPKFKFPMPAMPPIPPPPPEIDGPLIFMDMLLILPIPLIPMLGIPIPLALIGLGDVLCACAV